ncbi:hypothetical protein M431DRAFT_285826 [Trichoderma harzianum CBS 226.95]|uniref:Uncharacterized protein n=1 Tax=Trichoderma harzianum CBS 226.95 TaxID=983964 RepID=A0A2T4ANW5_TRIHA|nr:hypothetical protein M431DRAFT_285826 [Trichoderma harzianum CBS 226.95]PTB58776.1 hypothetical protein M431DRAFT_285826 [Trichoderma harzianum CBS 226.95]
MEQAKSTLHGSLKGEVQWETAKAMPPIIGIIGCGYSAPQVCHLALRIFDLKLPASDDIISIPEGYSYSSRYQRDIEESSDSGRCSRNRASIYYLVFNPSYILHNLLGRRWVDEWPSLLVNEVFSESRYNTPCLNESFRCGIATPYLLVYLRH